MSDLDNLVDSLGVFATLAPDMPLNAMRVFAVMAAQPGFAPMAQGAIRARTGLNIPRCHAGIRYLMHGTTRLRYPGTDTAAGLIEHLPRLGKCSTVTLTPYGRAMASLLRTALVGEVKEAA